MNIFHSVLLGQNRTTIPQQNEVFMNLVLSPSSVELSGTQTWMDNEVINHVGLFYYKRMPYVNGKTFLVYPSKDEDRPFGQSRLIVFDELAGIGRPRIIGNVLAASDTHSVGAITAHNGRLYLTHENTHDTPLLGYQGATGYDINNFAQNFTIGSVLSYAHHIQNADGKWFTWSRGIAQPTANYYTIHITEAASGFGSWGSQIRLTTRPTGQDPFLRHYPFIPGSRYRADGKMFVEIVCRKDDAGANSWWYRYYALTTPDTGVDSMKVFSNIEGTFSFDRTSGDLTDSILSTNYTTHEMDTDTTDGGGPVTAVGSDGSYYMIIKKSDGTEEFSFKYFKDGVWTTKLITTGLTLSSGQPFDYLTILDSGVIFCLVHVVDGATSRVRILYTTNLGDTWIDYMGDIAPDVPGVTLHPLITEDMSGIIDNKNFPIILRAQDLVDPEKARIFVKTAAFGAIQPMPGITPVAATDFNPRGLGLWHYKRNDANIVRSGNDVSQLTDLFGLRNATGFNNPQWNGVDAVTTNGSTSYFTIASVAAIAACTAWTYIVVARRAAGANNLLLCLTDNTGSTEQLLCTIGFSTSTKFANITFAFPDGGAVGSNVIGQDDVDDNEYHVFVFMGDGTKAYSIFVDGKIQFFQTGLTSASSLISWQQIGKGPAAITTVNAANIGRRDFTSDTIQPTDIKEDMFYSGALTQDEIDSIVYALCVDYGITYQSEYQEP